MRSVVWNLILGTLQRNMLTATYSLITKWPAGRTLPTMCELRREEGGRTSPSFSNRVIKDFVPHSVQQMCAVEFRQIHKFSPPKKNAMLCSGREFTAAEPQSFHMENKKNFYCVCIFRLRLERRELRKFRYFIDCETWLGEETFRQRKNFTSCGNTNK